MSDVGIWLDGLGLGVYREAFTANEIDWNILPDLTSEDLKDLGVDLVGHRRRLLKEIATIEQSATLTDAISPEQSVERRQVSVLFCDMVGSTSLAAQLDPEDLRDIQLKYQDAVAKAVTAQGGHIANFIGDGIVVYFGWPIATEDQAESAVRAGRAALEMISEVTILGSDERLAARAAIATGTVVVGDLAGEASHQSGAISGNAPNRASRLQSLAEAGQLLIDDKTRSLLKASFETVDLGRHLFKGIHAPVQVWQVEYEVTADSRFDAARTAIGITPLVGRLGDLELMQDRWRHAVSGEGQVVLLSGEAGIGKSRMIRQLYEALETQPKSILRYQCSHYFENVALHPVAGAMERAAQFERSDGPDAKFDKLEVILMKTSRPFDETAALVGSILNLPVEERYPPLEMSPQRQLEETLLVLLEQADALAEQTPVLLIVEDLHWADPTTLDLIGRTIAAAQSKPMLVLLTFRPEFVSPWQSFPHLTNLSLNRLGQVECGILIDQLTGRKPLPSTIKEQITDKADGVPLYVEELTKTVLDAEYVIETENTYEVIGDEMDLAVPATLHDTLMARLDRQSSIKNVAQIGACIGREFSYDLLFAIAGLPEKTLRTALDQLAEVEIVFHHGRPPTSRYEFKHALLRDAAYDSLLRLRKQQLHSEIVQFLEAQASQDIMECAFHSAAAGLSQKAATLYLQAGRDAMTAATFAEAISQLRLGLAQTSKMAAGGARDRLELDLRVALGAAEMASKGWAADAIREALDPAVPLAQALQDQLALGFSLFSIWIYHATRSEMKPALEWLAALDKAAADHGSEDLQMIADTAASMNCFWIGDFPEATRRRDRVKKDYSLEGHRHLVQFMNHDPYSTVLEWGCHSALDTGICRSSRRGRCRGQCSCAKIGTPVHPGSFPHPRFDRIDGIRTR
ncbi:adenylate/guanylate cyclase domain-containing protein [Sulfitobacter sediminilitoris]|uniref:adenylate/guanylate cyclase domain-containing protein n=1 Tax=Sulfitobacter sediminilitoris TaxID=2698830 RepID=UPI0036062BDF